MVGPLRPWMKKLAEWAATQHGPVKQVDYQRMAAELAGCHISRPAVRAVIHRLDWLTYREEMALDDLARAKKKFEGRYDVYSDVHFWAVNRAKEMDDYKVAATIAEPILDRLAPKRDDKGAGAATVIINLGGTPVTAIDGDYEPLPIDVVSSTSTEPNGPPA